MTEYSDGPLRLTLQIHRAQESSDPFGFRFEPQDYIFPTESGEAPSARFHWTPELLAELQSIRLPKRDPSLVQRLGGRLRQFVLDAGWGHQEALISQALAAQRRVLLTLRFAAAELYALPWELVPLKSGRFLGEIDDILLRFEWPESPSVPAHPAPRPEGGRILLAWSAAGGAVPAAEHLAAIQSACAAGFQVFDAGTDVLPHASLSHLVKVLESAQRAGRPISVLHILCHGVTKGSTFGLCLDGSDGLVSVDAQQLRQHLAPFASQVRLIVLSACDSANAGVLGNHLGSLAQALHRCGFQAVIASRFPLSTAGSITLTECLYRALLAGPDSVETAFLAARKRLALEESAVSTEQQRLDWASLQLYSHAEDGDDTRPIVFRPYRGLLAFQSEHRRFFFGRDDEISCVQTKLQSLLKENKERFLVVAGASGTGKSSLVLAGVLPRMLESAPDTACLRMRPGSDPERTLNEVLSRRPQAASTILVVDQFEEVFTQTESPAARSEFARHLWSLAGSLESDIRVIITLRVDFIGRCGELVLDGSELRLDRIAYSEFHRVFVAQLRHNQLLASIVEPAHRVGLTLEAGLAIRMMQDVGNEPGGLPLLEDTLDVLWQRRTGSELTQAAYDALGGVIGALQRRADALLETLTADDLPIVQRLLVSLVAVADETTLDTRLRVPLPELRRAFSSPEGPGFERVLKELVAARLLVQDGDEQTAQVEVAHEALIRKWPRLRAWLDEDRAGLLVQRRVRQAAQQWELQCRDESLLYRGAQLVQAQDWRRARENRLGDTERCFLDASEALRAQQEREADAQRQRELDQERALSEAKARSAKRNMWFSILLSTLLCISAFGWWLAYRQNVLANKRTDEAQRRTYASRLNLAFQYVQANDLRQAEQVLKEYQSSNLRGWEWNYLNRLLHQELWSGEIEPGARMAISANREKLATVGNDAQLRVLDVKNRLFEKVAKSVFNKEATVQFSQDSKYLFSTVPDGIQVVELLDDSSLSERRIRGDFDARSATLCPTTKRLSAISDMIVRTWDTDTAQVVSQYPTARYKNVIYSRDCRWLATVTRSPNYVDDGRLSLIQIWDQRENGNMKEPHRAIVMRELQSITFSEDGKILIASDQESTSIFETDTGKRLQKLPAETASASALDLSQDGHLLVIGDQNSMIQIWDVTGQPTRLRVLKGHTDHITQVSFVHQEGLIASTSQDRTLRVWDAAADPEANTFQFGTAEPNVAGIYVCSECGIQVKLSQDGRRMAGVGNAVVLWDAATGAKILHTKDELRPAMLDFVDGGERLVVIDENGKVSTWNAEDGAFLASAVMKPMTPWTMVISPDGQVVAGLISNKDKSSREESHIEAWDVKTNARICESGFGSVSEEAKVSFSPDRKWLALARPKESIEMWDLPHCKLTWKTPIEMASVYGITFSLGGSLLAVAGSGNQRIPIQILDARGGARRALLTGHSERVDSLVFSHDGQRLASAGSDGIKIWDLAAGSELLVLRGRQPSIEGLAFSKDAQMLLSASSEGSLRVWDGSLVSHMAEFDRLELAQKRRMNRHSAQ